MYQGQHIRIDDNGNAWLRIYNDQSDPDDPAATPVYECLDEIPLGNVDGALNPLVCLLEEAEGELDMLAEFRRLDHGEVFHDSLDALLHDYYRSVSPAYA